MWAGLTVGVGGCGRGWLGGWMGGCLGGWIGGRAPAPAGSAGIPRCGSPDADPQMHRVPAAPWRRHHLCALLSSFLRCAALQGQEPGGEARAEGEGEGGEGAAEGGGEGGTGAAQG